MPSLYATRSKVAAEDIRLEGGTTPTVEERSGTQVTLTPVNIDTIPASGAFKGTTFQSIRQYVDSEVGNVSASLSSSLSSLEGRVTANESAIQSHSSLISTNSANISSLSGRVTTVESALSSLHTRPPDGTLALLQQGTDTTQRIWSAADLANFSQAFKFDGGALKGKLFVVRTPTNRDAAGGLDTGQGRTYQNIYLDSLTEFNNAVLWEDSPSPLEVVQFIDSAGFSNRLYPTLMDYDDGGGGSLVIDRCLMDFLIPVFEDGNVTVNVFLDVGTVVPISASISALHNGAPVAVPAIQPGDNFIYISAVRGDYVSVKVTFSFTYSPILPNQIVYGSFVAFGTGGQFNMI